MLRSTSSLALLKVFSTGQAFLTSTLLARFLGPSDYGQYALVTSVISLVALPLYAGLPSLIVREVARLQIDEDWGLLIGLRRRIWQWIIAGSALVAFGLFINWRLAADQELNGYLVFGVPLVPLMALNSTRAGMLQGLAKVVQSQIPDVVVQPALHLVGLTVIAVTFGLTVVGALSSLTLSILFSFLVGHALLIKATPPLLPSQQPKYLTGQWFRSWLPFSLLAMVTIANTQTSTVMLARLSTSDQIGFLRVADRAAQTVSLSLMAVNLVLSPHVASSARSGDRTAVQSLVRRTSRLSILLAAPTAVILIAFGKPIVNFAFGSDYADPVFRPLVILSLAQLANVYLGSAGTLLNMSGFEKDTVKGIALGLITNFVVVLFAAPAHGASGAAMGTAAGILVWNFYLSQRVRLRLGIRCTPI